VRARDPDGQAQGSFQSAPQSCTSQNMDTIVTTLGGFLFRPIPLFLTLLNGTWRGSVISRSLPGRPIRWNLPLFPFSIPTIPFSLDYSIMGTLVRRFCLGNHPPSPGRLLEKPPVCFKSRIRSHFCGHRSLGLSVGPPKTFSSYPPVTFHNARVFPGFLDAFQSPDLRPWLL